MNTDDRNKLLSLLGLALGLALLLKCCVATAPPQTSPEGGSGQGGDERSSAPPARVETPRQPVAPPATLRPPQEILAAATHGENGGGDNSNGNGDGEFFGTGAGRFNRVIFLIDISKSMGDEHDSDSSLGRVKREFTRLAQRAAPGASYFAVLFDGEATRWPEYGGAAKFDPAAGWPFAGRKRGGRTALLAAWKLAAKLARDFQPEAFILLSDGAPTDCTTAELLAEVGRGPDGKVKIYCIALDGDSTVLRKLAASRDGAYRCEPSRRTPK
ncbi:MAG: VWA domain-containing protein [Victivallaceae bacterium]|nr:VWA domain-containing protein [Victivallaceae bacterium]